MAKCKTTNYISSIIDYKISDHSNKQVWRYNPEMTISKTLRSTL